MAWVFNAMSEALAEMACAAQRRSLRGKIVVTLTDEAPMLATYGWFPIMKAFCHHAGVPTELADISVAARILSAMGGWLKQDRRVPNTLLELEIWADTGDATIIKLPKINASITTVKECIAELNKKGYELPPFPDEPHDQEEEDIRAHYDSVLGGAVNAALRHGNCDRRLAQAVKEHVRRNPVFTPGEWTRKSKTTVRSMDVGDFYSNERSVSISEPSQVRIELCGHDGTKTVLRDGILLDEGDIIDGSFMDVRLLCDFYEEVVQEAKDLGLLFALHLKATVMTVSDPIMFGHAVKVYYKTLFTKHKAVFDGLHVDPNRGLNDIYSKTSSLHDSLRKKIDNDIMEACTQRGSLAMSDADHGVTNLHDPDSVMISHSMSAAMLDGGKMWSKEDQLEDFMAVIPDQGCAAIWREVVEFCKQNGAFDPKTMGSCANVGLMAFQAEEYSSNTTTWEVPNDGTMCVVANGSDRILMGHPVRAGDIYRFCQTRAVAVRDWIQLALRRGRANEFLPTEKPCKVIFWLDPARPHDLILTERVRAKLASAAGLDVEVLAPAEAMRTVMKRLKDGLNTVNATGNVLRDYLTHLLPTLELGCSLNMLSVVPMLNGGAMYETAAAGTAKKLMQQLRNEGILKWDSLGEYLALACALKDIGGKFPRALIMSDALNRAITNFLSAKRNPMKKAKELDTRAAHYWMARYWAGELAAQSEDLYLQRTFVKTAGDLQTEERRILRDLTDHQGRSDLGGHYHIDPDKVTKAMNPSDAFNSIIADLMAPVALGKGL